MRSPQCHFESTDSQSCRVILKAIMMMATRINHRGPIHTIKTNMVKAIMINTKTISSMAANKNLVISSKVVAVTMMKRKGSCQTLILE